MPQGENIEFFKSTACPEIEILSAHFKSREFKSHFHDYFTIGINDFGNCNMVCNGVKYTTKPHSITLMAPGTVHKMNPVSTLGWGYRNICFTEAFLLKQISLEKPFRVFFPKAVVFDDLAWAQLNSIFNDLTRGAVDSAQIRTTFSRIVEIHGRLLRPLGQKDEATRQVEKARLFLSANLTNEIRLGDLAQNVGLSPFHLARLFKNQTGLIEGPEKRADPGFGFH